METTPREIALLVLITLTLLLLGGIVNVLLSYTGVGYYTSLVEGESMEPNLQNGDVLIYGPYQELRAGDIVRYENEDTDNEVVHRIVEIDQSRDKPYKIKGDNNAFPDGWYSEDRIISEVEYRLLNVESLVPLARKTM